MAEFIIYKIFLKQYAVFFMFEIEKIIITNNNV